MVTSQPQPPKLVDRAALRRNRARATGDKFLHQAARSEIEERLNEVNRTFTTPLIVTGDPDFWTDFPNATCIPDDDVLEAPVASFDLVIHDMALHWANDVVGQLIQCLRALRPDGLFLAVCLGGDTLSELRACLATAESEVTGGLSPRIAPMADIRDMGGLLQRAGFALPVADSLTVPTTYASLTALARDLRAMGEGNALAGRLRHPTRRAVFERATALYHTEYLAESSRIRATFELLFLTGWAPHESQQKPLRPGSATTSLARALDPNATPDAD